VLPPQPPRDPTPIPPPNARRDGDASDDEDDEGKGAGAPSRSHLVAEFKVTLDRKVVDLAELRRLACQGVPDAAGIRPIVWKVR